jgi:hypothetical protein
VGNDDPPEARLREGADFASAGELVALTDEAQSRSMRRGVAERLAEAVEREVWWMRTTGELPCGLPWDRQPAWRVRLWEWLLEEQERVTAAERAMAAW